VLSYFDGRLSGRHFVVGESFSLADISVVTALGYLALRKPELLEGYEGLSAYVARQIMRTSLSTTIPPNLPVRG
jgi:glutathione S-transferase